MKSFFFIALIAGASAQTTSSAVLVPPGSDKDCLANYIVKQCLLTENDKLAACSATDYQCLCYASQAIATCYNNCPNDTRAPFATQSMNIACSLAARYSSTVPQQLSTAPPPTPTTSSRASSSPTTVFTSVTSSALSASQTNDAGCKGGSPAGVLAAVAGLLAAAL